MYEIYSLSQTVCAWFYIQVTCQMKIFLMPVGTNILRNTGKFESVNDTRCVGGREFAILCYVSGHTFSVQVSPNGATIF